MDMTRPSKRRKRSAVLLAVPFIAMLLTGGLNWQDDRVPKPEEPAVPILSASGGSAVERIQVVDTRRSPHPNSLEAYFSASYRPQTVKDVQELPTQKGTRARIISYRSGGGTVRALLEMPDKAPPTQGWPVLLVAHGYIPPRAYTTEGSYRLVTRHYAKGGFLVIKPDYRGHGKSEGFLPVGTQGLYRSSFYAVDVMNILVSIVSIPEADVSNVFFYGHSMGGDVGLWVLESAQKLAPVKLKAATFWAAVSRPFPENVLYFRNKRNPEEAERLKKEIEAELADYSLELFTPLTYLDRISLPLYVHHGTKDASVPFSWSVELMAKLKAAGVKADFFEYPGEDHNISKSFYRVMDRDMEFFRRLIDN